MLKTPRTLPERFNAPESALHQNQEKCPPCRARCPHRTLHLKDHAKGGDTPQGRPPEPPPKAFPPPGGRWHGEAVTDEGAFFRQSDSIARAGLEITPAAHRRPGTGGRGQAPPPTQRQGEARTPQGPMPASGRILTDGGRTVCVPAQGPGPRRPLGLVGKDFDLQFLADPEKLFQRWIFSSPLYFTDKCLCHAQPFCQLVLT